jgi:hypothetical protein
MAEQQSETTPKDKAKRAGEKARRTHADRALASLRAAKRGHREVSEPTERARLLLAEANVLALLDVAEALAGPSPATPERDAPPSSSD